MNIEEELAGHQEILAANRGGAERQLEYSATELNWDANTVAHYKRFIDACLSSAASILATCRAIAAMPDLPPDVAARVIEPFLLRAHEATHSMFLGMLVIENLVASDQSTSRPPNERSESLAQAASAAATLEPGSKDRTQSTPANDTERTCSFCGKAQSETPVVAAPIGGGICAACTRLAATIHGIALAD